MDTNATRELARIQSVLHVLKTQRETLSELGDIQAFRALEESFQDDLELAVKRGLSPADPVAVVRADWQRLAGWSDPIQKALKAADELGARIDGLGGKSQETAGGTWRPSLADLQRLKAALKPAPDTLSKAMEKGRSEVRPADWSAGRPYPELAEVADAMEWVEELELAESGGPWARGVGPRQKPLVASRLAVEPGSPMAERRLKRLRDRAERLEELLGQHRNHASTLSEVERLTEAGQVETARHLMGTLASTFGDLDYAGREEALVRLEKQLKSLSDKVTQAQTQLQGIGRDAAPFFIVPPFAVLGRARTAVRDAETVIAGNGELGKAGRDSEFDRTVSGWNTSLTTDLEAFRTGPMRRLRRWLYGTIVAWIVALSLGGVTFQLRVAALKAAEVRALAEARAKAEAEENERLRLTAEAKAKLAPGVPLEAGARVQLGGIGVRWIPAGRFAMGSPSGEADRDSDEVQHEVALTRGFLLAETECTQGQWEAVMGSNPSHFKGGDRPVETVNWDEAVEYCRKLTAQQRAGGILPEGWEWRLPTEAEWEYAARAGTTGARHGELDAIAWYDGNSRRTTHAVKGKQANAWGLHDMMGNVWEWCADWKGDYPTGAVTDPTGPSSGSLRVLRGGGWLSVARGARSASRSGFFPGSRSSDLGFRPALSSVR